MQALRHEIENYSWEVIQIMTKKKKHVGKRKRKGWRKRSPRCTLCTQIRWMGNIKGRHPISLLRQLQKEKYE